MNLDNIQVVVRSANERTEAYCKSLLGQLFDNGSIDVIRERPFSASVKKAFEIGINSKRDWLLCIDADVLISEVGLKNLLLKTEELPKNLLCIQGLIFDKFFEILRPAGNHLYNIRHLPEALNHIPKEGESMRPEAYLKREMALLGFSTQQSDFVIGIHDYEQFYTDIYRKCFLQAHKHSTYIKHALKEWRIRKNDDLDFQIAIYGATAGSLYDGEVFVDKRFLEKEAQDVLDLKGIGEKQFLSNFSINEIEDIWKNPNNINYDLQKIMFPDFMKNILYDKSYYKRKEVRKNIEIEWQKKFPFILVRKLGSVLIKSGKWLQGFAIKR